MPQQFVTKCSEIFSEDDEEKWSPEVQLFDTHKQHKTHINTLFFLFFFILQRWVYLHDFTTFFWRSFFFFPPFTFQHEFFVDYAAPLPSP